MFPFLGGWPTPPSALSTARHPWPGYLAAWRAAEGLHAGEDVLRALDARFTRLTCGYGPYLCSDRAGITEAAQQAAIDAGQIRATGIRYTGTLRPR